MVRVIVDYELVLDRLRKQGLVCNYYNSGAFGFPREAGAQTVAWVGPPDETIRAEAKPLTRQVPEPFEPNLSALAVRAWQQHLRGTVWVMPMSHWAYELDFGSHEWMPPLLETVGVDPKDLRERNNASAIEFAPEDPASFRLFLQGLLTHLASSDFLLAFPDRPVVCMVHHHKQLWWTTTDPSLLASLDHLSHSLVGGG